MKQRLSRRLLATICGLLLSTCIKAEVLESGAGGFVIETSAEVSKSPAEAYVQFLRIHEWWDGDHSWFGSADNFRLEPVVGGCFCEISGDKQAQHMRVSYIDPTREIRLLGGLGPLQMMGVHGAMSWKFEETESGARIIHRYAVSGFARDGLDKLAPVVDAVQSSQLKRLVAKLDGEAL